MLSRTAQPNAETHRAQSFLAFIAALSAALTVHAETADITVDAAQRGPAINPRWYGIKIALSGNQIRRYLDGELIHDAAAASPKKFFAIAGRDDSTGDVNLKATNTGDESVSTKLKLAGLDGVAYEGRLTVLQSASLSDNNSLDEPFRVSPRESRLENVSANFSHEFPAHSLTVLRLITH